MSVMAMSRQLSGHGHFNSEWCSLPRGDSRLDPHLIEIRFHEAQVIELFLRSDGQRPTAIRSRGRAFHFRFPTSRHTADLRVRDRCASSIYNDPR